ncbi:MAG: glutamate-5-semialdehyde dehydrogenase [Kiritimatiellae bacterium]|nr:glutamate-5-semialdehyde dehydrogenase [Kiritimatiellia bacterium]MCO5061936.1 glutamate-5-semialdehyde dehydrogenase [Kiritimatiellia bacterium]MCO6401422.1 glutamate-5-semialdehyde dehydrogenase [Verrucomicrobiota bacterium]
MNLHDEMIAMGDRAVAAARAMAQLSSRRKNAILEAMADELDQRREAIKEANARDMEAAKVAGLSGAMLDRLLLTDGRIDGMIKGIRDVVGLRDPVGQEISKWMRPNGLEIFKVRVPIGVIAIIYESRPNVTADSSVLCIKTGNAVILRGGKEALHSNTAIADALQAGGKEKGLPDNAIQIVGTTDRDAIRELVQMEGRVDLAIPRGGEGLIRAVAENARVPVIKHYKGVCYIHVDKSADHDMAIQIVENAKCQRPGVCNAAEHVLIDEAIAPSLLPDLVKTLRTKNVELRGDEAARSIVGDLKPATEADWDTEYLDLILGVKIVPNLQAAINHINQHGSHHSDAIVASDPAAQRDFTEQVDSATVYVNASTRFTDGAEFGLGAEIGISTDKLHARGPMGLEELTTYKYVIQGTGQVR